MSSFELLLLFTVNCSLITEIPMPNIQTNRILPNLFDKLTDAAPTKIMEPLQDREASIEKYKVIVLRDLIALLNSSVTIEETGFDELGYLKKSTLTYGMKSLAGMTFSDSNKQDILEEIKKAILKFESRIYSKSLKVELMRNADGSIECTTGHKININIAGILKPLQKKEKIFVKTEIDLETGRFELVA